MNNKTKQWVIGASALMFACAVSAHPGGKANSGYVGNANGHLVVDSQGKCVINSSWSKDQAITECDPSAAPKKAEAAPAPKPAPAAVAAPAPAPAPAPVVEKITLKAGALFDSGKSDLKPAGQRELDDLANKLKGAQGIESIQVTGHTDSQGQAASNQTLSEQRAAAVKSYLINKGVDGSKISTRGMGASNPVADNATAAGRAQNRRVELDIKANK